MVENNKIIQNERNIRNIPNSAKRNNKSNITNNNNEEINNAYNKNIFNKYNYLLNNKNNLNINPISNEKINYTCSSTTKENNEQTKENILLKSKISTLEQIIEKYEIRNKEFDIYMNICYEFFNNINQISMDQLNIDITQYNNKIIDINSFKDIFNKIESYVIFLQKELNNLNNMNSNNIYQNELENENNKRYNQNIEQNNNINQMNPQYEIYKTLEERINILEKELNIQKQNFVNINNNDIYKQNGTERLKKKKTSKKKTIITHNIYELPPEIPKTSNVRSKQKKNNLNKKMKNINNTNYNTYNQINQFKNQKIISNSNRKTVKNKDREKNNQKRSITPLNSRLKKYFN
jgi:hypothetical protein